MANSKLLTKVFVSFPGIALGGLIIVSGAYAANPEPVVVEVEFVEPITITATSPLQYGMLDVNHATAGETVIIAPNGSVTDSVPGVTIVQAVVPAAILTVTATAGRDITIDVANALTNGTGYTLTGFTCNYNGGTDTACDGTGYTETGVTSATLLIGATLTGAAAASAGSDPGSFDVTISYP